MKISKPNDPIVKKPGIAPDPEHAETALVHNVTFAQSDPLGALFVELTDRLDSRDEQSDDDTAPYAFMQRISSQINRAQSGEGPFSARFKDVAEIAIAALLSMSRRGLK